MYPNLKLAIFKRGIHQNHLAKELGINEAILSKVIRGYREPSPVLRQSLASYLQLDEAWLFEEFAGPVPAHAPGNGNSAQDQKDGDS
jgi:transcriptional regulator with XRE-family HTH domain